MRHWITALLFTCCLDAFSDADLILYNAKIYAVDDDNRVVEAVAIEGDRIVATGDSATVLNQAGPQTKKIDLHGKAVFPGFIDAHGHLGGLAQSLTTLNFVGTTSYDQIVDQVALKAESLQRGEWVLGRGWDQNDWSEKEFPRHEAMSRRTPDNPVYLTRVDGHAGFANAVALEFAGVTKATLDPSGGKIIRDEDGEPTGVLIDRAKNLVASRIPPSSDARIKASLLEAIDQCIHLGLTSVHDTGVGPEQIDLFKELVDEGSLNLRVYAVIRAGSVPSLRPYFEAGPLINYGDYRLTMRSIKCMADGALGSRGAALYSEYSDDPGNIGLMLTKKSVLESIATEALKHGFQVCTHAIGDRGNGTTLDAYEAAFRAVPAAIDHRFRIEHAQVIALKDIPRFAELNVIPSMQATHATSDMYWAEERVGAERLQGAYAWRKLIDAGSRIANGSDFPVESANPLWGFYAAITRQDHEGWPEDGWTPEERMTPIEALRSFTIDAAYAAFEEDLKGSIEAGKLADIVVLSKDIMTIPPKQILETKVTMTIIGGRILFTEN